MNAIFYDRDLELHRCHFAGMNEKGEPNWLIIEQGKKTVTLDETEKGNNNAHEYKLLCVEGEKVASLALLKMMRTLVDIKKNSNDVFYKSARQFVKKLLKYQIEWEKTVDTFCVYLNNDCLQPGKYAICICCDTLWHETLVNVGELDDLILTIGWAEDIICMMENTLKMDIKEKILEISSNIDRESIKDYLYEYNKINII